VCSLRAEQGGALVLVGSATFGASRSGPEHNGSCAPTVLGPEDCPPLALPRRLAEFARHLEIRPATSARPLAGGEWAELVAWMRFRDDRPLDAEAATVLTDALPPALFATWTTPRPVPSAELTVHFGPRRRTRCVARSSPSHPYPHRQRQADPARSPAFTRSTASAGTSDRCSART